MAAPAAAVWAWLLHAELWPTWYVNSSHVHIVAGPRPALGLGSRFRWRSFGLALDSTVQELVPGERIAWLAKGFGVRAYHAWLLTPDPSGHYCHVLTEETQNGAAARLGSLLLPNRMHRYHQLWLQSLAHQAAVGLP